MTAIKRNEMNSFYTQDTPKPRRSILLFGEQQRRHLFPLVRDRDIGIPQSYQNVVIESVRYKWGSSMTTTDRQQAHNCSEEWLKLCRICMRRWNADVNGQTTLNDWRIAQYEYYYEAVRLIFEKQAVRLLHLIYLLYQRRIILIEKCIVCVKNNKQTISTIHVGSALISSTLLRTNMWVHAINFSKLVSIIFWINLMSKLIE